MSGRNQVLDATAPTPPKKRGGLGGSLTILLVVVVILLVFAYCAARTDGFREYVEEQVQKRTGFKVSIEKTRVGWPYDLILDHVASDRGDSRRPGAFSVREARLGLSPGGLRITLTGGQLSMARTAAGEWEPNVLRGFGPASSAADLTAVMADFSRRVRLVVRDGTIEWRDEGGKRTAAAEGIEYTQTPLDAPGRRLYHFRLSARSVLRTNAWQIRGVEREWLATESQPYIEVRYDADWGVAPDAPDFWSRAPRTAGQEQNR
jgi:hypothetical protein